MQTEKEYLTGIANLLDSIKRAPNESRKDEMRTHLHRDIYSQKYRYGFYSNEEVRQSVDYLKAGKGDPTKDQRFERLKRSLDSLTKIVGDLERERQQEKEPNSALSFLKYRALDMDKTHDKENEISREDKEIDEDLERD